MPEGKTMFRVRSPRDLGAGLVFVLIGAAGLYFGWDLAYGSAARMGPGYFPTLLSYLIIAVGLVLGAKGLSTDGPRIDRVHLRPLIAILSAILAFGLLIDRIGLALTAAALTVCAAYARRDVNLTETLILAVGLALFTVGVFVYALTQPLPAWWGR
jgi:Tripartite tricarboxylate transporter TctB family